MNYYPILLSKAGELTALRQLNINTKFNTAPIIEILPGQLDSVQVLLTNQWTFNGNKVLLDFSLFGNINLHIQAINNFFNNLMVAGVNIVPVVHVNSNVNYIGLVINLLQNFPISVCFRNSSQVGFINYNAQINNQLNVLNVQPNRVLLLLDFQFVSQALIGNLSLIVSNIIQNIPRINDWNEIIISSGSFPENLTALSAQQIHILPRYEWNMWLAIQANGNFGNRIKYSDYGTKYPFYVEANFQGTCSIKYSTAANFVIYRGEKSSNHRDGNGQYITFSRQLISSQYYSGVNFSWGDLRINEVAREDMNNVRRKTGNSGSWVQISQNHHVTLMESIL